MLRFSKAFSQRTSRRYAPLVSLLALVACGSDGGNEAPTGPGAFDGQTPSNMNPGTPDDTGMQPPGTDTTPPSNETPAGEGVPDGVPLDPSGDDGNGDGNGATTDPPGEDPAPNDPTPGEPPAFVEDSGADCAVAALPNSDALPTDNLLPDPFLKLDGTRMTSKSEWTCRREEIKRQAERYIYGTKPSKPETVTGTVSNTSITVNVTNGGNSTSFTVSVDMPAGATGPVPALVSVGTGFFGFSQNTLVRNEGVAIINFDPYAIGAEGTPRNAKQGAFYDIYGAQSTTGLLLAWSWGVSRILDVIEQSGGNILKADATAVAGCSRFGKAAITVGAFDERIALTIPFESGSGGVPIWRGIPGEGAQSPGSAFGEQPWLGDAFGTFTNAVTRLPVDTHELLSMVAPRGLLILDNPHIANLGPRSAHVAALAGAEVFSALGVGDNISYHSSVADGAHCSARPEHQEPLRQNIRRFLLKTDATTGVITAAAKATGNLAEWRDWETPTLE
ncbi:MAG TPA: PE PGRS family protein [Polyangiaceae bacterium]|nr:PE PGRS family protein [Polyangiaceae bacterium]